MQARKFTAVAGKQINVELVFIKKKQMLIEVIRKPKTERTTLKTANTSNKTVKDLVTNKNKHYYYRCREYGREKQVAGGCSEKSTEV